MTLFDRIFNHSAYAKNVLTLASGTALSQAIPLAISPILTRLFTPEEFGLFALYFSILMICSVFATGKYELAILLPTERNRAKAVLYLSILICLGVSLSLLVIVILVKNPLLRLLNAELLGWQILWLPFGILGIGLSQSFYYYFNRESKFSSMAMIRIFRSISYSMFAIIGGFFAIPGALIFSDTLGYFISVTVIGGSTMRKDNTHPNIHEIKSVAYTYRNFPKFLILSGVLEKGSGQAPVFMLSNFFASLHAAGFFSFAQRIVIAPADLLARAIGDVFRQQASDEYSRNGQCSLLFARTFRKLFIIGVIPFTLAYLFAPNLFEFVFGEAWREAGLYAKVMMPMFFLQFVVSPLSSMFVIAGKQKYDLLLQFCLFCSIFFTFLVGKFWDLEIIQVIQNFCVVYCIKYCLELYLSFRFSKKHTN